MTNKTLIIAGASLALCCGAGIGRSEIVNAIVATIDGEPITLREFDQFAERAVRLRQLPPSDRNTMLDAMITEKLIQKEVSKQGIVIQQEDVDRYLENIKRRNRLTDEQLRQALEQQGMTWDAYLLQVRHDLQKVQLINREIRGKVNITPEDIDRYYQAHREEYGSAEGVSVSHILLRLPEDADPQTVERVTARADEIYQKLSGGADFSQMARQYSEDGAAEGGGKLGTFREGEMLDELAEAIRGLAPGQFSKPFRSRLGVHIVRFDGRVEAGAAPPASDVEAIKDKLYNQALEERYNRWLREDLRARHHVEILR